MILEYDELFSLRSKHPQKKLVHCHGVFDLLHAGHLAYFQSAKKFGDILIVTLTSDRHVNKGPGRPYFSGKVRAEMIAALKVVDFVAINDFPTAVPAIHAIKPDYYVKGPDYKNKQKDITGGIFAEEAAVQAYGGELVFTDDDTHSSSTLLNQFFQEWTEEQIQIRETVNKMGGVELIEKIFENLAQMEVRITGEPIVDTYVFCTPENLSSKFPAISAKYIYEENYAGGVFAIANHLADFVKKVDLYFTHGGEPYFRDLMSQRLDRRIQKHGLVLPNVPTPRKTRFISTNRNERMFELTDLRSDQWLNYPPQEFCRMITQGNSEHDTTIVADFGHGLFEGKVLETLTKMKGFIGLNVQTNSSNFGYNPYNKHKRFDFLSIDTKEVRVAFHDRYTPPLDLARKLHDETRQSASCAMTLGAGGAFYFEKNKEHFSPSFVDSVVDATGAGDAFFGLTTLLVRAGCPPPIVPFLGNVFAGLKTRIIGNKSSVSKTQLLKAVNALLK